jgi:hypothetical protein
MLFPLSQVDTNLRLIEDIPNTFFQNIQANKNFGYELFPTWFIEYYGNRTDGLYLKASNLFNVIKISGRETEIVEGYILSNQIETNCLDFNSVLFYCESISEDLLKAAKEYFHLLYKSLDYDWLKNNTNTNIIEYIREFKLSNKIYLCPICGNEKIAASYFQDRTALDHWFSKAKYPFNSVNWRNLIPIGSGCNGLSVKGENEIIWTNNQREARQNFYYPYSWIDNIHINFICIEEPSIDNNMYGIWRFDFIGVNDNHQDLINKWNTFFKINDRWIYQTLYEFIVTWTNTFAKYLNREINIEDFNISYNEKLVTFCNVREDFNNNPQNRVEWFYLNYLINEASIELFDAYKGMVRDHLENIEL